MYLFKFYLSSGIQQQFISKRVCRIFDSQLVLCYQVIKKSPFSIKLHTCAVPYLTLLAIHFLTFQNKPLHHSHRENVQLLLEIHSVFVGVNCSGKAVNTTIQYINRTGEICSNKFSHQFSFSCPFSEDLFKTATQIYEQRLQYETLLWENYNVDESDVRNFREKQIENVFHGFFSLLLQFLLPHLQPAGEYLKESGADPKSVEIFRKAGILIGYEGLIREALLDNNGTCDAVVLNEFHNTLEEYTECVPKEHRCSSKEINCNGSEK